MGSVMPPPRTCTPPGNRTLCGWTTAARPCCHLPRSIPTPALQQSPHVDPSQTLKRRHRRQRAGPSAAPALPPSCKVNGIYGQSTLRISATGPSLRAAASADVARRGPGGAAARRGSADSSVQLEHCPPTRCSVARIEQSIRRRHRGACGSGQRCQRTAPSNCHVQTWQRIVARKSRRCGTSRRRIARAAQ